MSDSNMEVATPRGAAQPEEEKQEKDEDPPTKLLGTGSHRLSTPLKEGERPAYLIVDMEGFGCNPITYPTYALAIVVMSNQGRRLYWSSHYLPYKVGEKAFEPRCWQEFVSCKLDQAVYRGYVRACAESPYKNVAEAWEKIAAELDWIYDAYDQDPSNPLVWVADCDHYDLGRLNQYFSMYTGRKEAWYSDKRVHWIRNISEGKKAMRALNPKAYHEFEAAMKQCPYNKSHDPVDDASHIGFEYVTYKATLDKHAVPSVH